MAKINQKKVTIDGIEFDSTTEGDYYQYLRDNKEQLNISEIEIQPQFQLMEPFTLPCNRCKGEGKKPSPKTGNPIKCKRCDGTGRANRESWNYTADFLVEYKDGHKQVIDVKGYATPVFRCYRKLFEYTYKTELVIIKRDKKGWKIV